MCYNTPLILPFQWATTLPPTILLFHVTDAFPQSIRASRPKFSPRSTGAPVVRYQPYCRYVSPPPGIPSIYQSNSFDPPAGPKYPLPQSFRASSCLLHVHRQAQRMKGSQLPSVSAHWNHIRRSHTHRSQHRVGVRIENIHLLDCFPTSTPHLLSSSCR